MPCLFPLLAHCAKLRATSSSSSSSMLCLLSGTRTIGLAGLLAAGWLSLAPAACAEGVLTNYTEAELRGAVALGGMVRFGGNCSITLTQPLLIGAGTNVTLDASNYDVTISGGNASSLFTVDGALTLRGLTLSDGRSVNGGALRVNPGGVAWASNCTFTGNSAIGPNGLAGFNGGNSDSGNGGDGTGGFPGTSASGGALYNRGNVTFWNCTLSDNTATGGNGGNGGNGGYGTGLLSEGGDGGNGAIAATAYGGAICNLSNLIVVNCTFSGNTATGGNGGNGGAAGANVDGTSPGLPGSGAPGAVGAGGGIYNARNLVVRNCTFSSNTVRGGDGADGGISSSGDGIAGASGAIGAGGALYCTWWAVVTNCTFYTNTATGGNGGNGGDGRGTLPWAGDGGNGGNGVGGALRNTTTLTLVNCTIANCSATGGSPGTASTSGAGGSDGTPGLPLGAGVANKAGGVCTLMGSILSTNLSGGNAYGSIVDGGYNLSSDGSPALGATGFKYTDPKLGPLSTNGGPTATMALSFNSKACDKIPDNRCPDTDQRGMPRPINDAGDIGAYEYEFAGRPLITQDPTNAITTESGTATFSVTAVGAPPLSYQWMLSDIAISNATSATYTLTNATPTNEGPYTVVITNLLGSFTSPEVRVDLRPAITGQPTNQIVTPGTNVTFAVTATGDPTLSYHWYFNATNLLSGTTGPVLVLTNVQVADAGAYSVAVSNYFGGVVSTSATLNLLPIVLTQPADQLSAIGGSATFSVAADGSPPLGYQWKLNGAGLPDATNASFTVTNVTLTNLGPYAVLITNPVGSVTSTNAFVRLAPAITAQPTNQAVLPGASVAFSVTTIGDAPLSYQWYQNATNVLAAGTNSVLALTNVQMADIGTYSVRVTNAFGATFSDSAALNLLPILLGQPAGQTITAGSNVTFSTTAAGSPPLGYQWRFNTNPITGATSATYSIPNVAAANAGIYDVVVTNCFGSATSQPAALTVLFSLSGRIAGVASNGVSVTVAGAATNRVVVSAANGAYSLSGLPAGAYTVTPALNCYAFTPTNCSVNLGPANATGIDFAASTDHYTVTGQISDGLSGVGDVTVQLIQGATVQRTNTDAAGNYAFANLCAGAYAVVPTRTCTQFYPLTNWVTLRPTNAIANFLAGPNSSLRLTGRIVTSDGAALPGVAVSLSGGASTNTDSAGNYTFLNLCPGAYNVTPSSGTYGFAPASRTIAIETADAAGVNFVASPVFSISGLVLDSASNGLAGIAVEAVGGGFTTNAVTATNGTYTISGLSSNAYTVAPVSACYIYNVSNQFVIVGPTNATGINFFATNDTHIISGMILGLGQSNVAVQAVGQASTNLTFTGPDGSYVFPPLCSGPYTVTPLATCALFSPPSRLVTLGPDSTEGNFVDFSAVPTSTTRFALSGRIMEGTNPLSGVTLQLNGQPAFSDADGNYFLSPVCPGSYPLVPSLPGYKFQPPALQVSVTANDLAGLDFAAIPIFSLTRLTNGCVQLHSEGSAGLTYRIDVSSNLTDWQGLLTNPAPINFTDCTDTNAATRFYRLTR